MAPAGSRTATRPPTTRSTDWPQYGTSTASVPSISTSPVDVTEDEVEGREDRDDVGDVHALERPRHDGDVVEAGRADLDPERAELAPRHHVVTHLAERILRRHPGFAFRHLDDARHLGHDGAGG